MGSLDWSTDGSILRFGGRSFCTECGQDASQADPGEGHAPSCTLQPGGPTRPPSPPIRRRPGPNEYVWTDQGIERALDVERRRRR